MGQDPSKSDVLTVSTNPDGVVKLVGGGGAIVTLDRLGASFVDNVGAANPNDGKMRVRVAGGITPFPVMIEAAFPIAGGKHIVHQIGREADDGLIRHYSAYIAEKVVVEQVHLSNGINDESAVINIPAPTGAAWSNTAGERIVISARYRGGVAPANI